MSENPVSGPTPADFFNWISQFAQPMMEAGAKMAAQMPATSEADPLALWKNLTEKNEKAWTEFLAQMVNTPEFASGLGRTISNQAAMREAVRNAAQTYLEVADMPTREDITRLAGQLVNLDARIDDLQDKIDDASLDKLNDKLESISARLDRLDQQAAINERLSKMDDRQDKLDRFLERLEAIESKLDKLSSLQALATTAQANRSNGASRPEASQSEESTVKAAKNSRATRTSKTKQEDK
ncbi:MAG TPA: poly(R)-hydroxyalkanoic acid synthase subunit PhaE [Chloroflexia bacterium]|nr:poly(R)-hydroxyalkanoic acid synthase subunit PhaE [Chloroflexia bacterium]